VNGCAGTGDDDRQRAYIVEFRPVLIAGPIGPGSGGEPAGSEGAGQLATDFEALDCTQPAQGTALVDAGPGSSVVACGTERGERFGLGPAEIDGSMVESVAVARGILHDGAESDDYVVSIELNADGTAAFASMTERLRGLDAPRNRLAVLAGQEVLSAPTVQVAITEGEIAIAGQFSEKEARDIAAALSDNGG